MKNTLSFLLFFLLVFQIINAQEQQNKIPKRIYTTKFLDQEKIPVIDGILDDAGWNIVEWQTDFIENDPDENTPPTFQTKFKIVYDTKFIYVAIRAIDKAPDSIVKRLSRRDGFEGDRVNVIFDSYHDERTAFIFTITAVGVKGDEIVTDNGNNIDDSWNPVWYTKANIDSDGWTAEMKIPLSQLRFGKAKEQIWGLNIVRNIFRKNERSLWQRIPVDAPGFISEAGELHGLINLIPQKQLEIQPFTVTQFDTYPAEAGNPFRDGNDFKFNVGLDAKIGITNDLTLDLTVNPDFGQVEADPAAIALDGFEIFFEEQRPFFVENKNIFDFRFGGNQDNLFFSRRVGRSPQGFPNTTNGEFVDQPQNTTILGAAKFSGKTKDGWSIGILESVTSKEYATIDNNGERRDELVEPFTNYFVGRLQKDFNDRNSFVGGIFTATNRKIEGNLDFLRKSAYTGGLDFRHQWKDRKYYIEGNVIMSQVQGSKKAIERTQRSLTHLFQRADASHVEVDTNRTSLTGTGGRVEFGKASVGHWRYGIGANWRSPELELNDIGFLRQADEIRQYAWFNYRSLKPFGKFRNIRAGFNMFTTYDFEGNYNRIQYRISSNANYKNNWWTDIGFIHKPRIFTNTILQGGPRFRFSRENISFFFFGTDSRKKLRFRTGYVYSQAKQNSFSFLRIETGVTYQPINSFSISLNPEYSRNPNKTQYVTETNFNGTPRYITAEIDQQTLSASIRLNYTINPNLTIQYYGQPFISRGTYKNFNFITNPVADDLYDRFQLYDNNQISFNGSNYLVDENTDGTTDYEIRNPDFSFVQFRSNLVVRWEYIPGSEIFLVWSQGNTGSQDPKNHLFRSLDNQIFGEKADNTFLIKATYRFVL
ncbi:MAG: carbohydrate binding family 9 domain-containing protein [Flavobacteriaceae bacterium]|nr:carbohydrate binding family 9 domain-containing protein [Flavobacteriaceae bacterium]